MQMSSLCGIFVVRLLLRWLIVADPTMQMGIFVKHILYITAGND